MISRVVPPLIRILKQPRCVPTPRDRRAYDPEPEDAEVTRKPDGADVFESRCGGDAFFVPGVQMAGHVAQRVAWAGVRLFGAQVLPGAGSEWDPPCGDEAWEHLTSAWRRVAGSFDSFGVHLRRPLGRDGFSVLLIESGQPKAFVKIRRSPSAGLRRELIALNALSSRSNPVFEAPEPMDTGDVDGWEYLMLSPLPPHIQRW